MHTALQRLAICGLLLLVACPPAQAHGFMFECRPRGDHVEVEAFFSDDTPARDALVRVLDQHGQVFAQGRTDDQGRWRFPKPLSGQYRVHVDAGAGHARAANLTDDFLSTGPTREEFTRFPWLKVAVGVTALLALGFGFKLARRKAASRTARPSAVRL